MSRKHITGVGSKQTVKLSRLYVGIALIVGSVLGCAVPALAESYGGGSPAGYAADAPIDNGRIVILSGSESNKVAVAGQSSIQNMFGVTVDRELLPMTLTNENVQNEVFVAVSGTYNVLVSTQAGAIMQGDYVTLSSIDGVAMQAGTEEVPVFGRAQANFDGKGVVLGTQVLTDDQGGKKTVTLGSVPVTIDIKNNPNHKSTEANVPEFLQRVGQQIAEKEVSPIRIYLSVAIAAVSLVAAIAVLYAGIRNSVISIGRNPMSKHSIFRALVEVILTSVIILIIGVFAVYLLLKL